MLFAAIRYDSPASLKVPPRLASDVGQNSLSGCVSVKDLSVRHFIALAEGVTICGVGSKVGGLLNAGGSMLQQCVEELAAGKIESRIIIRCLGWVIRGQILLQVLLGINSKATEGPCVISQPIQQIVQVSLVAGQFHFFCSVLCNA